MQSSAQATNTGTLLSALEESHLELAQLHCIPQSSCIPDHPQARRVRVSKSPRLYFQKQLSTSGGRREHKKIAGGHTTIEDGADTLLFLPITGLASRQHHQNTYFFVPSQRYFNTYVANQEIGFEAISPTYGCWLDLHQRFFYAKKFLISCL